MGQLTPEQQRRVGEILATVRPLAAEFYRLTGKPLGVTGEVGEQLVAQLLGLTLADVRTAGYDATRPSPDGGPPMRLQIKARAYLAGRDAVQRMGRLTPTTPCDAVLLVLLEPDTLDIRAVWEAPFSSLAPRLVDPASSSHRHGSFKVTEFIGLGTRIWPPGTAE